MRRSLINILCCPICKESLDITIKELCDDDEILTGTLICKKCNKIYAIEDGIPNLIPQ